MTVQKKQAFGRILRHRLDAAKLFPNQIISCDKIISDRLSPSQIRFYYLSL